MLENDYLVAKIGVDTAENEPRKELRELRAQHHELVLEGLALGAAHHFCQRHTLGPHNCAVF